MIIKYHLLTGAFLLLFGVLLNSSFAQDEDILKIAQKSLTEWKKVFSDDQIRKLGFDGKPFPVFTVDPEAVMTFQAGTDFERIVKEDGYRVFPVMIKGKNKALLWMYQKEGKWKVARIGSSKLSQNVQNNERFIDEQKPARGLENSGPPRFVRFYQLSIDFFFIKGSKGEFIIPMQNIPELNMKTQSFISPAEIVPLWKEELQKKKKYEEENKGKGFEG
jgi:hypothetical protein